jgi:hypothetical protein
MRSIFTLHPWRSLLALFLVFLLTIILPGIRIDKISISYGFPFDYLRVYPDLQFSYQKALIEQIALNPLGLFLNFYLVSVALNLLVFLYGKIKREIRGCPYPAYYYRPGPPPKTPQR